MGVADLVDLECAVDVHAVASSLDSVDDAPEDLAIAGTVDDVAAVDRERDAESPRLGLGGRDLPLVLEVAGDATVGLPALPVGIYGRTEQLGHRSCGQAD